MAAMKIHYFAVGFLLFIFLLATGLAVALNTDFGSLDAKIIVIPNGDQPISGLLYLPRHADSANPSPGIVLVHGISSAKQSMSGIALELARRGFVALAIDAVGHGRSGGQLTSTQDPTLGALAAVRYLESQSFVNALPIGLVGHSLGAGAIRATAVAHGNIGASVYIGGGLGSMVSGSAYGVFNSTFPKNLLFAVGKYDVLFDLTQLRNEALLPIFGVTEEVSPGRLYGDFSTQTARKLITPVTTHLFEPSDPYVVSETVSWMTIALQPRSADQNSSLENNLTYLYREAAMIVSLIAFIGLILPVSLIITSLSAFRSGKEKSKAKYGVLESWKTLVV